MLKSFIRIGLWSLVIVFALTNPVTAQQSNKQSEEADRAAEAANVLTEIMNIPEDSIPEDLMARAHGIAVIPHVVKGAFGFGGQWGKGLMSQRREDGSWRGFHPGVSRYTYNACAFLPVAILARNHR